VRRSSCTLWNSREASKESTRRLWCCRERGWGRCRRLVFARSGHCANHVDARRSSFTRLRRYKRATLVPALRRDRYPKQLMLVCGLHLIRVRSANTTHVHAVFQEPSIHGCIMHWLLHILPLYAQCIPNITLDLALTIKNDLQASAATTTTTNKN
jgi:hypothetical protein